MKKAVLLMKRNFVLALIVSMFVISSAAFAAYPEGPITIVVPYSAGGAMDITTRLLTKYAAKLIGQPIVTVNIPGGSGAVGATDVFKSKPDGYKLLVSDFGPGCLSSKAHKLPFDIMKDFSFCARQITYPRLIVARTGDKRFSNGAEFFDYVKKNPGNVHVATAGARTDSSVLILALNQAGGLEMVELPSNGTSEALSQVLGGHVDAGAFSTTDIVGPLADGEVFIVGVADNERCRFVPDAPTFKELGLDVVIKASRGYAFKAGTDPAIVEYFDGIVKQVSEDPEYQAELEKIGLDAGYLNSKDYTEFAAKNLELMKTMLGD